MSESADWTQLAGWWLDQIETDSAYQDSVIPLLLRALEPQSNHRYLDLGCGEGQVLRAVQGEGSTVIGCDLNTDLLSRVSAPTVCCMLPNLDWVKPETLDGVFACLVVEHIANLSELFRNAAQAVKARGVFALVINHPLFTAPGSGPVVDPTDGEVFWRWGTYLTTGTTTEPAGATVVSFHHRSLSALVNAAAGAGWCLEWMEEAGVRIDPNEEPLLLAQQQIPRLMAIRLRLV